MEQSVRPPSDRLKICPERSGGLGAMSAD
ncbi:hypothetical protein NSND_50083 [Nitrospira sp. ND1]|nr:hypothetical protein NSND_50083 [Nitrospira sp. ND1]